MNQPNYQDYVTLSGESNYAGTLRGYGQVLAIKTKGMYTVATLATEIATRFALIAAEPDGEDSAGRQKLRMPNAKELAGRSCEIASELWAEFESRGWLFDLPLPPELPEKARERQL